MRVEEK